MLIMVPYKHVGNIVATELLNSGKLKLPHLVYLKVQYLYWEWHDKYLQR